jgi:hypothetical protein
MCFLTPEEVEKCTGAELMGAALDLISDTKVIDFFTKLVR